MNNAIKYIVVLLIVILEIVAGKVEVNLGVFTPYEDNLERYVYDKAVENARDRFQSNEINVKYTIKQSKCTDATWVTGKMGEFIYVDKVAAIIGPECSEGCAIGLNGVEYTNKLMVSSGCTQFNSGNSTHFARVKPFIRDLNEMIADYYAAMADYYDWHQLGIVFSMDRGWKVNAFAVRDLLVGRGYKVEHLAIEAQDGTEDLLKLVNENMRIVMIMASEQKMVEIMFHGREQFTKDNYAVITVDVDLLSAEHAIHELADDIHVEDILKGTFNIRARMVDDQNSIQYKDFKGNMTESFNKTFSAHQLKHKDDDFLDRLIVEASYIYDAILLYTDTMMYMIEDFYKSHMQRIHDEVKTEWENELIENATVCNHTSYFNLTANQTADSNFTSVWTNCSTVDLTNTTCCLYNFTMQTFNATQMLNFTHINETFEYQHLVTDQALISKYFLRHNVHGLTGNISIAQFGIRRAVPILTNYGENKKIRIIYQGRGIGADTIATALIHTPVVWMGQQAKDTPECGFENLLCEEDETVRTVLFTIGVIAAIVIAIYILWRMYKLQQYENDVNSKISMIPIEDIKSTVLFKVEATIGEIIESKGEINRATNIKKLKCLYKNKNVMVKKLPKERVFVTRDIMVEMKQMRDLGHSNLSKTFGVTVRAPYICMLQDYCKKGSLYDVLANEDIQLDWVFKHTFLWEIVNGMCALHDSPIKLHGHLTSKNCLINHRWVLQIADYGMHSFKEMDGPMKAESIENDQERYESLLWTAPENINIPRKTSRSGDVYSFGIIISEVINRKPPFAEFDDMRPSDIIHYVKKRCIPPFRPHVTLQTGLDHKLLDIMHSCVSESIEDRPTFKEIKPVIKVIRGETVDILDNMIEMMERYSSDLDKTAKERSEMFRKEKIKSNELLYRCVPKPIVSLLLEGAPVEPQSIDSVSVLAMRIDNFNQLSAEFNTEKAVQILNDYYKMVDRVLLTDACQSLFKLIAVKDEIVLCSNVPGYKDVSEAEDLARVAVKISISSYTYKWKHIRFKDLNLRIALHTGRGVGVVVGNKIPVYKMFGAVVDETRSMARHTQNNRIVCTEAFEKLVRCDDRYAFQEIGQQKYKGIGYTEAFNLRSFIPIGNSFPGHMEDEPLKDIYNKETREVEDDFSEFKKPSTPFFDDPLEDEIKETENNENEENENKGKPDEPHNTENDEDDENHEWPGKEQLSPTKDPEEAAKKAFVHWHDQTVKNKPLEIEMRSDTQMSDRNTQSSRDIEIEMRAQSNIPDVSD